MMLDALVRGGFGESGKVGGRREGMRDKWDKKRRIDLLFGTQVLGMEEGSKTGKRNRLLVRNTHTHISSLHPHTPTTPQHT